MRQRACACAATTHPLPEADSAQELQQQVVRFELVLQLVDDQQRARAAAVS